MTRKPGPKSAYVAVHMAVIMGVRDAVSEAVRGTVYWAVDKALDGAVYWDVSVAVRVSPRTRTSICFLPRFVDPEDVLNDHQAEPQRSGPGRG